MKRTIVSYNKRLSVWNKTNGRCWYCGINLVIATKENMKGGNIFVVEHVDNLGSDELSNLVPSCSNCNRSKKQRTLEEFRTYISMPLFNQWQVGYLKSFGIEIPQPKNKHVFFGETL